MSGRRERDWSLFRPELDPEIPQGHVLLNHRFVSEADGNALAFIMAERGRVEKEQAEGEEAVRIALRAVQVHSVDHAPGRIPWHDEIDEMLGKADVLYAALPEDKKYKLSQCEILKRYREAA